MTDKRDPYFKIGYVRKSLEYVLEDIEAGKIDIAVQEIKKAIDVLYDREETV